MSHHIAGQFISVSLVTIVVAFGLLPQILKGGGQLRIVLCNFTNEAQWWEYHEVVGTLKPYYMQKNLFEHFPLKIGRERWRHVVELSQHLIHNFAS